ncbi:MAG: polysaccharide deacetylase family protein [Calditrichia bacterium]
MDLEDKTYFTITIDTEADFSGERIIPISKMVYGKIDGKYYGIGRIMDICKKYGVKATFFVSTFESEKLGDDGMKAICREIDGRGHDVQLHTHPKWITGERFMWCHPLEKQIDLLSQGKEKIKEWIGKAPIAHRAGGFGADHKTLSALKRVDIPVDSTYMAGPYCRFRPDKFKKNNASTSEEGIIELPVTEFRQFKLGRFRPVKPLDINANTLSELKFVINSARKQGIKVVTLLMHSFSFLHRNRDRTVFTPNKGDMAKFDKLLQFISKNETVEVITVSKFYEKFKEAPDHFDGPSSVPVSGYFRTVVRAFRYFKRGRGNKVIAMSVMGLLFTLILVVSLYFQAS